MIPRAFRVLLPCPVTVEQEQAAGGSRIAPAATIAAGAPLVAVGQRAAGVDIPPAPAAEHQRLSVSAQLWRDLAARLGGM